MREGKSVPLLDTAGEVVGTADTDSEAVSQETNNINKKVDISIVGMTKLFITFSTILHMDNLQGRICLLKREMGIKVNQVSPCSPN